MTVVLCGSTRMASAGASITFPPCASLPLVYDRLPEGVIPAVRTGGPSHSTGACS
jgi:hypothetical protein